MKEEIEKALKQDHITSSITRLRTYYVPYMSEFTFIKIFIDVLKTLGYTVDIKKDYKLEPIDLDLSMQNKDKIKLTALMNIKSKTNEQNYYFDSNELNTALNEFNRNQSGMGMQKSTIVLIDIFLNLL